MRAVLWTVVVSAACSGSGDLETEPPPDTEVRAGAAEAEPAAADAGSEALRRAESAAAELGKTLKGRLQTSLKEDGPAAALQMCSTEAATLTAHVATSSQVRTGRSSLRLRNPGNAGPDWVTAWLDSQGERPAQGVAPVSRVDTLPDGTRLARVIKPLEVGAPCLLCHGATLAPDVQDALSLRYPRDQAVGYAAGDLRGALWAEAPVR